MRHPGCEARNMERQSQNMHWISRSIFGPFIGLSLAMTGCFEPNPHVDDGAEGGTAQTGDNGTTTGPNTSSGPSTSDATTQGTSTGTSDSDSTEGEGEEGETRDDSGTDTEEPPFTCPAETHTCVGEPPNGWTGPVSVQEGAAGESLAGCDDAYSELVAEHATDPTAQTHTCNCSCGNASGSCNYQISGYSTSNCTGGISPFLLQVPSGGQCVATSTSNTWWNLAAVPTAASCQPSSNQNISPATLEGQLRVCGTQASSDGCEAAELCTAIPEAPLSAAICIYQEGEHVCPAGPYTERTVHHTAYTDTRDCSPACDCDVSAACTGAQVTMYRHTDSCQTGGLCSNPPCSATKGQGCSQIDTGMTQVQSLRLTQAATFAGSCAPEGYEPVGELTPTDPVTVCCMR
jgi:hypothetical protein